MKNQHLKHLSELLLAALFISTSGPLGRFIDMPPPVIIWWRCFLSVVLLYLICYFKKESFAVKQGKDRRAFFISAVFFGGHLVAYFYALKFSNVALGMLSMFVFPVITALLEPFFGVEKFKPIHVLFGGMILLGIYILAPDFSLENSHMVGILFGLLSALFFALRNLIMKQHVAPYEGTVVMFYQMLVVTVLLAPVLFTMDSSGIKTQYPYIIVLALLTTVIGHTLFVRSLKYFSAATASIIISLQPIFGIIIAFLFLNEIPSVNTFYGGALILSTVVIESILSKKS